MRRERTPTVVRRLKEESDGAGTLFLIHPGALDAEVHRTLAGALPDGVGLTVVDVSGVPEYMEALLTRGPVTITVEALAGRLLDELAAHRGTVYGMAGWSFGGVLAHAMIEQMPAPDRPSQLLLLDSIAPIDRHQQTADDLDTALLLRWFSLYLGAKRGRRVAPDEEQLTGLSVEEGLLVVRAAAAASGALPAETSVNGLRKLYETYVDGLLRNIQLTLAYRASESRVPVVLVTADRSLIADDPTLGWETLAAKGLEVHRSPGDHYTMLSRQDAAAAVAGHVQLS